MDRGAAESGVAHGGLLLELVDAAVTGEASALDLARRRVRAAIGDAAFVDAAATLASFNAVVKLADGTGIPLEDWKAERTQDIRTALAIDAFRRDGTA